MHSPICTSPTHFLSYFCSCLPPFLSVSNDPFLGGWDADMLPSTWDSAGMPLLSGGAPQLLLGQKLPEETKMEDIGGGQLTTRGREQRLGQIGSQLPVIKCRGETR